MYDMYLVAESSPVSFTDFWWVQKRGLLCWVRLGLHVKPQPEALGPFAFALGHTPSCLPGVTRVPVSFFLFFGETGQVG